MIYPLFQLFQLCSDVRTIDISQSNQLTSTVVRFYTHCWALQIANCGPADYNFDESVSTLRYANRAKNIKNNAKINEDPKDALLRQFQLEIERLKKQLEGGGKLCFETFASRKPAAYLEAKEYSGGDKRMNGSKRKFE